MAIITLISDFGLKDHYVSSVKGAILKQLPTATIIDISHQIEKYNKSDHFYGYSNFTYQILIVKSSSTQFDK